MPYWLRRVGTSNDLVQEQQLDGWPLEKSTCPTLIVQGTADHMMSIIRHKKPDEVVTALLRAHP
jgi:hypothetical protein